MPPFLSSSEEAQLAELLSPRPLGLLQAPPHGEARSPCSTSRSPERSQWSRWAQFPAPALHTHLGPPPGASRLDFSFLVPTPLLDPSVCFLNRHSTLELRLLLCQACWRQRETLGDLQSAEASGEEGSISGAIRELSGAGFPPSWEMAQQNLRKKARARESSAGKRNGTRLP